MEKRIVLASASPRRKELLSQIGLEFEIMVSDFDEIVPQGISVSEVPMELSRQKALDVYRKLKDKKALVIGADTIVSVDDKILGKPVDDEEAFRMLKELSGRCHKVYTGVSLVYSDDFENETVEQFVCETIVRISDMTDDEIKAYISTKDHADKAGSYGIQGIFAKHVEGIEGDYYNVVGLPLAMLYKNIKKILKK